MKIKSTAVVTALLVSLYSGSCGARCEKADLLSSKLITDVCWDCIFPLVVARVKIGSSSGDVPAGATDKYMCACRDHSGMNTPGIATSFWEPARLIEFQTRPGCMSALNMDLGSSGSGNFSRVRTGTPGLNSGAAGDLAFYHYHYYAFPLLEMLNMFTGIRCGSDGYNDFDLMYMSELDPTWDDPDLAFFVNPEAALVANPVAESYCMADSISSTVKRKPLQELFWCAGSWGGIYPLSGYVHMPSSRIKTVSLLTARVLASLHRRGLAFRTMGSDAMCRAVVDPMPVKGQYRFNMIYPVPETHKSHVMGESVLGWGGARFIPGVAENPVFMIFRWHDCCNTLNINSF